MDVQEKTAASSHSFCVCSDQRGSFFDQEKGTLFKHLEGGFTSGNRIHVIAMKEMDYGDVRIERRFQANVIALSFMKRKFLTRERLP